MNTEARLCDNRAQTALGPTREAAEPSLSYSKARECPSGLLFLLLAGGICPIGGDGLWCGVPGGGKCVLGVATIKPAARAGTAVAEASTEFSSPFIRFVSRLSAHCLRLRWRGVARTDSDRFLGKPEFAFGDDGAVHRHNSLDKSCFSCHFHDRHFQDHGMTRVDRNEEFHLVDAG